MYKLLALCSLISASSALFPHHHHIHHPAVSHQEVFKHDGPHHPIPIHHPAPLHHVSVLHPVPHIPHVEHIPVPIHHVPHHEPHHDHYAFPEYNFAYSVHDHHTGDVKSQHEHRHGDVVQGGYELIEPDGRQRKVEYKADDHTGSRASGKQAHRSTNDDGDTVAGRTMEYFESLFNAVVHHSSPHHHVHLQHHV